MVHIVGVVGSLRKGSYNHHLLQAALELMPEGATLELRTIEHIPLYNADLEAELGLPEAVISLKQAFATADGVILATPEYNNGIPGVFKNAIDWASRPPADVPQVFAGKPFGVIGASTGGFGTILAQDAWLSVLRFLGAIPWCGKRVLVSLAEQEFDADGRLINDVLRQRLKEYLAEFVTFVQQQQREN